jgi:hypothetical protein
MRRYVPLLALPFVAACKAADVLPWIIDPLSEHGRPFRELNGEGFLLVLEKRF